GGGPEGRSRRCIDEAGRDVEPRARGSEGGLERRGEVEKERPGMVPSEPRVRPEQRVAAPDVARRVLEQREISEEPEPRHALPKQEDEMGQHRERSEEPERDRLDASRLVRRARSCVQLARGCHPPARSIHGARSPSRRTPAGGCPEARRGARGPSSYGWDRS